MAAHDPAPEAAGGEPVPSPWSARARAVASLLIAAHLAAVVIGPSATPPPTSDLARGTARLIEPYLYAASLYNGYRFFAPDPGPSHIVRYEARRADGKVVRGTFPDPAVHRPRLLYHRHLMLSETLNGLWDVPDEPPPDGFPSPLDEEDYRRARHQKYALIRSVKEFLARQHAAEEVRLYLVEHNISYPRDVRQGWKLTDERLYRQWEVAVPPGAGGGP
jgi:hypothetical protein